VRGGGGLSRFARESRKVADSGLAIPIAFLGVAIGLLVRPYLPIFLQRGVQGALHHIADAEIYSRTVLAANYYNDGFVRRGLGGTIASALSSDWNKSIILFIIISLICFFAPTLILLRRLSTALAPRQAFYVAAVLALSPQAFFGWSRDPSRTDLLVAGSLAFAVVAWLDRRRLLAVCAILCGLLVHETAVVFGLPLLALMMIEDWRSGGLDRHLAIRAAVAATAGIGAILLLQFQFGANSYTLAEHMLREAPALGDDPVRRLYRDIAVYMAVAGPDALKTAMCYNFRMNGAYWLQFASCLIVLIAYAFVFPLRRQPIAVCIAMCVPAIFMMLIANDTGRWLKLSVLAGWLIAAFYMLREPDSDALRTSRIVQGGLILAILLAMGTTRHNNVNPLLDRIARAAGFGEPVSLRTWMDTCDPRWERYTNLVEIERHIATGRDR
jgi:hypothetical protein